MSAHRFFLTSALGHEDCEQLLPLSAADAHHAADVLRLRVGEVIDVVEPDGRTWSVRVAHADATGVWAEAVEERIVEPMPRVTLFQGVAKGDKMDAIVRQATEIGAEQIVPLLTSRCVVQLDARKRAQRTERWSRIAQAAAKQAKRSLVPRVADVVELREAIALLGEYDCAVVLWEDCAGLGVEAAVSRCAQGVDARVAVIVGPEGGLSAEEVDSLAAVGAIPATLGPTILRTETAGIVALALALHALGGLGRGRE